MRSQPLPRTVTSLLHTVTASTTYGHTTVTYGHSLYHVRLHHCYMRLQPLPRTVTASTTCGYSLYHMRLQALILCGVALLMRKAHAGPKYNKDIKEVV